MTYSQLRANLKEICSTDLQQAPDLIGVNDSVNKKLEVFYSKGDDSVLFRTFEEWQKLGYKVSKGEKAFLFWGTPQEFEIRNPNDPSKIESVGSYCPVVFKFSENQVYNPLNLR